MDSPRREGWGSVEGKEKKKKERHGRCSRGVERGVAERKWKPASLLDPLQRFYLPFRQCQPRGFIKQFLVAAAGEKSAWKIDSFRHGGCLRTRFLREPPFPPAAPPQDHLYYRYRDGRESPENVIKSVSTAFYRAHTAGSCCAIVLAPQTNVWMPPARTKIQISKLCEAMGGRPLGRFHRICKKFKRIESIFCVFKKSLVNFYIRDCILVQILKNFSTFPRLKFNKKKIVLFQSCYPSRPFLRETCLTESERSKIILVPVKISDRGVGKIENGRLYVARVARKAIMIGAIRG